jgi:hypothetical protein
MSDFLMEEDEKNGQTAAYRRVSLLLKSLDDTMLDAVERQSMAEAMGIAANDRVPLSSSIGAAPKTGTAVFTPSGRRIDVKYKVVEGNMLTASHDKDLKPNPAYPSTLQPRDRSRPASINQVQTMAATLNPERLGASTSLADGAPLVGPDGVIESGNGRFAAIMRAHASFPQRSAAYRQFLTDQGYDISGMKNPVLVRERTTPLTDEERIRTSQEGNANPALAMSATEEATADAKRLTPDVLDLWRGGDIGSKNNAPFVRAFSGKVLNKGEEGAFATKDKGLSLDGERRIRNALLQRAYGSTDLVTRLAESGDEDIRAFGRALSDAAGDFAKLRSQIETGAVPASMDIAPDVVRAADIIRSARAKGMTLSEALAQHDAFDPPSRRTENVLQAAYGDNLAGRMSSVNMAKYLSFYATEAAKETGQARLLGNALSPDEILAEGQKRYGKAAGTAGGDSGIGASAGAAGNGERGPGASAPGAATAGGRESAIEPPAKPRPEVNVDPELAARYRAARSVTKDRAETFDEGPVGRALRGGSEQGGKAMTESAIPANFFSSGDASYDHAQAYIKAVGGKDEAVALGRDWLASDYRRNVIGPDGVADQAKANEWVKSHAAVLRHFPELRDQFSDIAKASEAVEAAAANRREQVDQYNNSAAKSFIGADPDKAIARAMGSVDPAGAMTELMRMTANSPAARESIQTNLVRHVLGNNGDGLAKALADPKTTRALAAVLDADQMRMLRGVAQSYGDAAALAAQKADSLKAFKEAVGRNFEGLDPQKAIERIMGSGDPTQAFGDIRAAIAKSPEAQNALSNGVLDWIKGKIALTGRVGGSEVREMSNAGLQDIVNKPQIMRALNAALTPEQVATVKAMAADAANADRSVRGVKLPAGSNSAQDIHASKVHTAQDANASKSHGPSTMMAVLLAEALTEIASHGGHLLLKAGALGAGALGTALRTTGLNRVDQLVVQGVLHSELGAALMRRVPAQPGTPAWKQLLSAISTNAATPLWKNYPPANDDTQNSKVANTAR